MNAGRSGLEFFVGVPGSVGGAVRQNAGCFGVETRERLVNASVVDLRDGTTSKRGPEDLDFAYRHSNLSPTEVVTEAVFSTEEGDIEAGLQELRRITRWRRDHQPGGTFNAGSVFKNPEGISAGELIDSLGLKGLKVGDVSVSKKHANFFVAGPEATSADILELVRVVKTASSMRAAPSLSPRSNSWDSRNEHRSETQRTTPGGGRGSGPSQDRPAPQADRRPCLGWRRGLDPVLALDERGRGGHDWGRLPARHTAHSPTWGWLREPRWS